MNRDYFMSTARAHVSTSVAHSHTEQAHRATGDHRTADTYAELAAQYRSFAKRAYANAASLKKHEGDKP